MKRLSPADKKLPACVLRGQTSDSVFGVNNLLKSSQHCFHGGGDVCDRRQSPGPSVDKLKRRRQAHNPNITETSCLFTFLRQMAGATN
ncbi:unnamed protein product [Pleuronectes platessa]|uniref:Uncharacterized protein n=1 Tax=Pleuronectes platessa TaxID=8262 RepID=A0A9N7W295_PLEPL|nr:unnamed protein product [Pleuronectes platessa]